MKEIKSFLLYFIKFEENSKILPKKDLSNFVIKKPDQQLIIMIIYNKSIFFVDNSW